MIYNKTPLDLPAQFEASRVQGVLIRIVLMILGAIIAIVSELVNIQTGEFEFAYILGGLIIFAMGITFNPLLKLTIKKGMKKGNLYQETVYNEFSFDETHFEGVAYKGEENIGSAKFNYVDLVKVIETKEYFLIYITMGQIFVVRKSETTNGTNEELRSYFRTKVKKFSQKGMR